jgi:hypothetical protein
MIRKSLFWGLTVILVAALVGLILRGRRLEKQEAAQSIEVVRQSQPSPTRVLAPQDLEIEGSTMQQSPGSIALHEVEIHNNGSVPYNRIQLEFVYLDRAGKVLLTKTHSLDRADIKPRQSFTATDIRIEGVPASAAKFRASILFADMLSSGEGIEK